MADRRLAMINSDGKRAAPVDDPPGLRTELVSLRLRWFARTPYDHLFTELGTMDVAERALDHGADGLFVDTFADYGVDRIRAITDRPVVGAGEASIAEGAALGSFSIVTVWPRSMAYIYDERLRACPGGDACGGVHHVTSEDELDRVGTSAGVQARMRGGDGGLVEEIAARCRLAVEEDGTAGVVLGCTCMSPIAEAVSQRANVRVLDPSRVGLRMAHRAVREAAMPDTRLEATHRGTASAVVDAFLDAGGEQGAPDTGCQVCAIAADEPAD